MVEPNSKWVKTTAEGYRDMADKLMTEDDHQALIFEWAHANAAKWPELEVLHAVPNGGKRCAATAARLKRTGTLAGVCDIHLPVPRGKYASLWIELKAGKNRPTKEQLWFIDKMNGYGSLAVVAYGYREAIGMIEGYLGM